jgi:hypothetical protein
MAPPGGLHEKGLPPVRSENMWYRCKIRVFKAQRSAFEHFFDHLSI